MILVMLLLVLTIVRGTGSDLYIIILFEGRGGGVGLSLLRTKGWRKIAASAGGYIRIARQCRFLVVKHQMEDFFFFFYFMYKYDKINCFPLETYIHHGVKGLCYMTKQLKTLQIFLLLFGVSSVFTGNSSAKIFRPKNFNGCTRVNPMKFVRFERGILPAGRKWKLITNRTFGWALNVFFPLGPCYVI